MIGQLTFDVAGRHITAQVNTHFAWQCEDTEIQNYLNAVFPVDPKLTPDDPRIAHRLYQAAERLGAHVSFSHAHLHREPVLA